MIPKIIAISGISSNCGKTTLLCGLLRKLSNEEAWEAIKLTRGHYRSCGKDPEACCVSNLLGDEPVIRSGHRQTYAPGKDTGLYWDAGAANVHWVIATNDQVEKGIIQALERVRSKGVLVEGTSFIKFVKPDFSLLVVRPDNVKMKPSARIVILNGLIDGIFISGEGPADLLVTNYSSLFDTGASLATFQEYFGKLPIFTQHDLSRLVELMRSH